MSDFYIPTNDWFTPFRNLFCRLKNGKIKYRRFLIEWKILQRSKR